MKKRLHVMALAIAALLALTATSLAATTGVLALGSSPRSTVTPAPKTTKRVQQPKAASAAKIRTLEKALAKAKARVKALQKALAKAKTLAKAKANVKSLEKALAKAKKPTCPKGYQLVKGKCRAA